MARISPFRSARRRPILGAGALLLLVSTLPGRAETAEEVVQMMADATVIDATCRTTNTMYGAVFRYGTDHGIAPDDILLSGHRRTAFEAAMTLRLTTTTAEEICGALQERYRAAFPDWFRTR